MNFDRRAWAYRLPSQPPDTSGWSKTMDKRRIEKQSWTADKNRPNRNAFVGTCHTPAGGSCVYRVGVLIESRSESLGSAYIDAGTLRGGMGTKAQPHFQSTGASDRPVWSPAPKPLRRRPGEAGVLVCHLQAPTRAGAGAGSLVWCSCAKTQGEAESLVPARFVDGRRHRRCSVPVRIPRS